MAASPKPRQGSPQSTALGDVSQQVRNLDHINRQHRELNKSLSSQAATLKRDIALVSRQIEFERERRRELERLSEIEKLEAVPPEHTEAILKRDEDLRAIQEEKMAMMEWLRRGVSEAQAISMDAEALRVKVDSASTTQIELMAEKSRLEDMQRRIQEEIEETGLKIRRLTEAANALEEHAEHQKSLIAVTSDIYRSTSVDKSRLQEDVEMLQTRARDIETIEIAVGCMAASVRRGLHGLECLQEAVARGKLAEEMDLDDDGYDSDSDADATRSTPVVLSSTKAKMGRCEALLLTIQSGLKRYEHDESQRQQKFRDAFTAEEQQLTADVANFKKMCEDEVALLEQVVAARSTQLRVAIKLRDQAVASGRHYDIISGMEGSSASFSLTDYYNAELGQLRSEIERLKVENQRFIEHNAHAEGDYSAVRQLKHEYRELEAKKMTISQGLRDAEEANRALKFELYENKATAASPYTKTRPPWRTVGSQ